MNRRALLSLLGIVLIFLLPMLGARWYMHYGHPRSRAGTNRGTLIQPPINLAAYRTQGDVSRQWRVVYVHAGGACDEVCRRRLHMIGQIHKATGKYQRQVGLVMLVTGGAQATLSTWMQQQYPGVRVVQVRCAACTRYGFYVMDPRGFLILGYPASDQSGRLILKDLEHLLRRFGSSN